MKKIINKESNQTPELPKELFRFSDERWQKYSPYFNRMEVPAKTILLREGEKPSNMYFIEKGCLRVWFNNDGKDLTMQFFFEKSGVASLESFRKGNPSTLTIETVEPSILWYIKKQYYNELVQDMLNDPAQRMEFIDFIFERTFTYMKLFQSFVKDTPRQRYLQLLKENPHIIKRIPQHYIASYLGITTVHLSRIKSQLSK